MEVSTLVSSPRAETNSGKRVEWLGLVFAAAALLALRLPFLPPTLDDIDSLNFDLGVHDYDPVRHQPHPPGFPVYIVLARLIHPAFDSHAAGLAAVSALFGSLAVVPLYLLMRRLTSPSGAALVCALTLFNPIVWFNSVRPMSDLTGFFVVTAAQCVLVTALLESDRRRRWLWWLAGTAIAGISIGVRVQAVCLVGPLMLYGVWRLRSPRVAAATALCLMAAVCLWLAPMFALSGGVGPFVESFSTMMQAAVPADMLVTGFTLRRAVRGVVDIWFTPWQGLLFGFAVLSLAAAGTVVLARTNRALLTLLAVLFLPYVAYHYLTQATQHLRYAIPIVPLTAFLAAVPILAAARIVRLLVPLTAAAAIAGAAVITLPALAAYHSTPSPPFQALAALDAPASLPEGAVVTGHYVFERYLALVRQHEVLMPTAGAFETLRAYWNGGGHKPVLFLRDPRRTTLLRFGLDRPERLGRWRWPMPVRSFMQGERPGEIDLVRLDAPGWFSESGLLVTAEAGPLEKVLAERPTLRVRASPRRRALVVSGFLSDAPSADVSLTMADRRHDEWAVGRRFTLRTFLNPTPGESGYLSISLGATRPSVFTDVWLEPDDSPFIRPADGFFTAERDDAAELFRWMAPDAVATAYLPRTTGHVTIEGWIPTDYYRLPITLSLEWNDRPLASVAVATPQFRIEQNLPSSGGSWGQLRIRSSQSFVPDELQKNGDRRTLAARIYRLSLD
jgi:hypothetical protein